MLYLLLSVFEPWWHSDHTWLSFHFSNHSWYEHFWWNHRPDQLEKSWQRQRNCPGWVCSSPDVGELDKLTIAFWNPFLARLDRFQKLLWFSYQLKRPHVWSRDVLRQKENQPNVIWSVSVSNHLSYASCLQCIVLPRQFFGQVPSSNPISLLAPSLKDFLNLPGF